MIIGVTGQQSEVVKILPASAIAIKLIKHFWDLAGYGVSALYVAEKQVRGQRSPCFLHLVWCTVVSDQISIDGLDGLVHEIENTAGRQ